MASTLGRIGRSCSVLALAATLLCAAGSEPAQAGKRGGALMGGLLAGGVGGALLMNAFNQNQQMHEERQNERPTVVYQAVPTVGVPTGTVEERLLELKNLCNQGLVSPGECQARQAQILQGL